jgi:hypothetical protein
MKYYDFELGGRARFQGSLLYLQSPGETEEIFGKPYNKRPVTCQRLERRGDVGNVYEILVGKPEGSRLLWGKKGQMGGQY